MQSRKLRVESRIKTEVKISMQKKTKKPKKTPRRQRGRLTAPNKVDISCMPRKNYTM
jgi:hypothetical protein